MSTVKRVLAEEGIKKWRATKRALLTVLPNALPRPRSIMIRQRKTGKGLFSVMNALSRKVRIQREFGSFAHHPKNIAKTVSMGLQRVWE